MAKEKPVRSGSQRKAAAPAANRSRSRKEAVAQMSGLKTEPAQSMAARPASRRDKKGVLIYVSPAVSKQLRGLAIENETSVQALGIEAINLLLAHYRLKPIA
jgi:hypothetical protein